MESIVQTIAVFAIPVLLAITLHEAAHGYVARHLGDDTAALLGRITLNPLRHIDPMGTVVLPLMLLLMSGGMFVFGYAKPVPVNVARLRNPKRDMLWVAVAGPLSNLVQSAAWLLLGVALLSAGVHEHFFVAMARAGVLVNLVLAAFNLLPLPPLDGGRVLVGVLPGKAAHAVARIEPYGFAILIGVLLLQSSLNISIIGRFWVLPIISAVLNLFNWLLAPFCTGCLGSLLFSG